MAVLGVGFLLAVGFCISSTGGGKSGSSSASSPPISAEKVDKDMDLLATSGLVTDVEEESGTIFVNPALWNGITVQAKEGVAQVTALWMKQHGHNNGWCKIRDRYSGALLAEGSQAWGATIK